MARTVRDAKLDTRAARLRLHIRPEPYWRTLEKGLALGYRRRANGGTWLARRWAARGGYVEHKIATADDLQDAEGVAVLDFGQAQRAAREWWRAELRREEGHDTRTGPLTVGDAIMDYLRALEGRGGRSVYHARCVFGNLSGGGFGELHETAYHIADLSCLVTGKPRPRYPSQLPESPAPGRRSGTVKNWIFQNFVRDLLISATEASGRLTLEKNIGRGTLIEAIKILEPYLPTSLVPRPLPVSTLQRIKDIHNRTNREVERLNQDE